VAPETGGENGLTGSSEGAWARFRERVFAPIAMSRSSSTDDAKLPNLSTFAEAVAWARDHEVASQDAFAWTKNRTPPKVDLRLAHSSLPVVSELLVSGDMPMARTALVALQLNGAEVETDAESASPSTRFDVRFPDGTGKTVEFTQ
jgi:hypothetical protein